MQDTLKIRLDHDDYGAACILAEVYCGNFSGKGEAWFNLTDIEEFLSRLSKFIETQTNPPSIKGGNWDSNGGLKETLLSFEFYSFSNFRFGLLVNLADVPSTDCRKEEISRVTVELKPNVNELIYFADQMGKLLRSEIKEAELTCQ